MPALVAIEVSAPEPKQAQWVSSMLEACTAALEAGACVYAVPGEHDGGQVASVTWSTHKSAMIVYRDQNGDATVRRLQFQDSDEPREKWRTVGFTTALLAGGQAPADEASVAQGGVHEAFYVATTARFMAASGMSELSPKLGGQLRIDGRAWQAPWLLGVSAEHTAVAWSAPGIEGYATWSELGFGAVLMSDPAPGLQLFTRVDLVAQRLMVTGRKKAERSRAQLWQPGVRLALDLMWSLQPRWYAVLGAQATMVTAPVVVRIADKTESRVPAAAGGLSVGVQHRF